MTDTPQSTAPDAGPLPLCPAAQTLLARLAAVSSPAKHDLDAFIAATTVIGAAFTLMRDALDAPPPARQAMAPHVEELNRAAALLGRQTVRIRAIIDPDRRIEDGYDDMVWTYEKTLLRGWQPSVESGHTKKFGGHEEAAAAPASARGAAGAAAGTSDAAAILAQLRRLRGAGL